MSGVLILGSGMAGWGAAHRLHASGVRPVMLEKNGYIGGHAASHRFEGGWTFDEGPHVSFTSIPRIQELLAGNVAGQYRRIPARVNNLWQGHWIKHPAQCNLHGLPPELIVDCIRDFVATQSAPTPEIRNYRDWLLAAFGKTFAGQLSPEAFLLLGAALLVVSAGLQDPGNLGTIIRSLEAFGGTGLLAGESTVSVRNPKTVRASA